MVPERLEGEALRAVLAVRPRAWNEAEWHHFANQVWSAVRRSLPIEANPIERQPLRTIENVTELYVFASNGFVNTCKRGEANTTQTRTTAEVELAVGQRMIVERGQDALTLEVLP